MPRRSTRAGPIVWHVRAVHPRTAQEAVRIRVAREAAFVAFAVERRTRPRIEDASCASPVLTEGRSPIATCRSTRRARRRGSTDDVTASPPVGKCRGDRRRAMRWTDGCGGRSFGR
jgi:hypothetical protein